MKHIALNPDGLPQWPDSFSQVRVAEGPAGRVVFISGQVAVDEHNRIVGTGDLNVQSRRAFLNLKSALEAAGAGPADVVRLGIYVVGYRSEHAPTIRKAMREVFTEPPLPTSTWLGVERLALDGLLIEVDAIAVV